MFKFCTKIEIIKIEQYMKEVDKLIQFCNFKLGLPYNVHNVELDRNLEYRADENHISIEFLGDEVEFFNEKMINLLKMC